jgi:hypothetical protein
MSEMARTIGIYDKGTLTPKADRQLSSITRGRSLKPLPPTNERWRSFIQKCTIAVNGIETPINPFPYQQAISMITRSGLVSSIYIVKSRQMGLTLFSALESAFLSLSIPGFKSLILSLGQRDTTKIGRRLRNAIKHHNPRYINNNVGELAFTNGSTISLLPNVEDVGRGDAQVGLALLDEAARLPLARVKESLAASKIWGGNNSVSIAVTTPETKRSDFWQIFTNAPFESGRTYDDIRAEIIAGQRPPFFFDINTETRIARILLHYSAVPQFGANRNLYLKTLIEEGLRPDQIEKEANLEWDDEAFDYCFAGESLLIAKWEPPIGDSIYSSSFEEVVIGVDPSGFGSDEFAIVVTQFVAREAVFVRREVTFPIYDGGKILAHLDIEMASISGSNVTIVVELNGVGAGFFDLIRSDDRFNRYKLKSVHTNKGSKSDAIAFIGWLLSSQRIRITPRLAAQCSAFRNSGRDGLDDLVAALIHACSTQNYRDWYAHGLKPE